MTDLNLSFRCSIKDDYRTLFGLKGIDVVDIPADIDMEEDGKWANIISTIIAGTTDVSA